MGFATRISLKQEYDDYVEGEIEDYKDRVSRSALLKIADEAVVRLHAAALNHRDVWIKQGAYAGLRFPIVPGSDGAGVVTEAT